MRTIQVSTEVFAAIWGSRQTGEDTEDAILRRKYGINGRSLAPTGPAEKGGYYDARYNAQFREGLEIFRNYHNIDYRAKATGGGFLLLNDGRRFPSLNTLSDAIGASENAWNGWRFIDDRGREQPVNALRDRSKVRKRTRVQR